MKIHGLHDRSVVFYPTHDRLALVVRFPWRRASGCTPANEEQAHGGSITHGMAPNLQAVPPSTRSCNRHQDCDEADADTTLGHGRKADHCDELYCEDCFGY